MVTLLGVLNWVETLQQHSFQPPNPNFKTFTQQHLSHCFPHATQSYVSHRVYFVPLFGNYSYVVETRFSPIAVGQPQKPMI